MTAAPVITPTSPLCGREREFINVCLSAAAGLQEAIDLVLLHNEQPVRGNQPRASLNPITAMLAVASWERFVVDIRALSGLAKNPWQGPGLDRQQGGIAQLPNAASVLAVASAGRLPHAWSIRVHLGWRGKLLNNPRVLLGADHAGRLNPVLAAVAADYIGLRHSVAHRAYPQHAREDSMWNGDAATDTVQAGAARATLAVFLQLVDQSIQAIASALIDSGSALRRADVTLPRWWFQTQPPPGVRGVTAPGRLWGNSDLIRGDQLLPDGR